ncbi:MAG: PfkB family carbohydrate kinase [Thermodesulfobacteriota bacterium]
MLNHDKIKTVEELAEARESFRRQGKKVVHCHGVFDLLHIGHIRYFEQARQMGDLLIVTLTPDRFVDKGPHRPAFPENLRAEAIASLNCVDLVAINQWPTAEETLRLIRPDVYVKGSEFRNITDDVTGKIGREAAVVKEIGARLAFTDDIVFSSTTLINRYLSTLPDEMQQYLNLFRHRYTMDDLLRTVDRMSSLRVLVIGDTILDDYVFCAAIGTSSKDPALAVKYQSHDLFAGGVLAVANHVANFAETVQLVTVLGEKESHEDFIRSKLSRNITPYFLTQPDSPTLIKRRYVDGYTLNKLFEVYIMDDSGLPPDRNREVCGWLAENLPNYDLVIAADFGHGAVSREMVATLSARAPFLAINTQANAGNRGFHTVSRYPRADFVCIAEHEIRLELRDLKGDIHLMMEEVQNRIGCDLMVVTRGRKGCAVRTKDGDVIELPSFTEKVVDRIGAGDAFLSVSSLAAALGVEPEIVGFLGNVTGAIAVQILGNKKPVDRQELKKHIITFVK